MNMYIATICVLSSFLVLSSSGYAEIYNERFISEKAPVIAFTNARLIDGTGAAAKENQTVVKRGYVSGSCYKR